MDVGEVTAPHRASATVRDEIGERCQKLFQDFLEK